MEVSFGYGKNRYPKVDQRLDLKKKHEKLYITPGLTNGFGGYHCFFMDDFHIIFSQETTSLMTNQHTCHTQSNQNKQH